MSRFIFIVLLIEALTEAEDPIRAGPRQHLPPPNFLDLGPA